MIKKLLSVLFVLLLASAPALASDCGHERKAPEGFQINIRRETPVDDSWFEDAMIIGDSITDSIYTFDCFPPTLTVKAIIGQSAQGAINNRSYTYDGKRVTMAEMVVIEHPAKLLVMLGGNGLDKSRPPYVLPDYHKMIDYIVSNLPDTEIYLISVLPVHDKATQKSPKLNNDNIRIFNEGLMELCQTHALHYIDVFTDLLDERGKYASTHYICSDGMHVTLFGGQKVVELIRLQVGED